jgi:hypothetical protein
LPRLKERAAGIGGALAGGAMKNFQNRQTIKLREGNIPAESIG